MRAAELFTPALIRSTADVTPANVARAVGIEVTRLDVRARGRVLVDGAHLSVAPGELVAVAGASGAGKSTLLEAVAGLRPIASGSVRFVRRDGSAPAEIAVGFVPQDDIIHRDLPLRTSLCLAARLRLAGLSADTWVSAVTRPARLANLWPMRVSIEFSAADLRAPAPCFFFGAASLPGVASGVASGSWLAAPDLAGFWMTGVSSFIARW